MIKLMITNIVIANILEPVFPDTLRAGTILNDAYCITNFTAHCNTDVML